MRAYYPESAVLNLGLRPLAVVTFPLVKHSQNRQNFTSLGTCQKLAGGEGGVGILNLGSEIR